VGRRGGGDGNGCGERGGGRRRRRRKRCLGLRCEITRVWYNPQKSASYDNCYGLAIALTFWELFLSGFLSRMDQKEAAECRVRRCNDGGSTPKSKIKKECQASCEWSLSIYVYEYAYADVYVGAHVDDMYGCMDVWMYVLMYGCILHVCMYVFMYVCMNE
jgi:hypothetical protein